MEFLIFGLSGFLVGKPMFLVFVYLFWLVCAFPVFWYDYMVGVKINEDIKKFNNDESLKEIGFRSMISSVGVDIVNDSFPTVSDYQYNKGHVYGLYFSGNTSPIYREKISAMSAFNSAWYV